MYRPPETIHLAGPTPVATPWLPWLWLEDDLSAPRHSCAEFIPGDSRPRAPAEAGRKVPGTLSSGEALPPVSVAARRHWESTDSLEAPSRTSACLSRYRACRGLGGRMEGGIRQACREPHGV